MSHTPTSQSSPHASPHSPQNLTPEGPSHSLSPSPGQSLHSFEENDMDGIMPMSPQLSIIRKAEVAENGIQSDDELALSPVVLQAEIDALKEQTAYLQRKMRLREMYEDLGIEMDASGRRSSLGMSPRGSRVTRGSRGSPASATSRKRPSSELGQSATSNMRLSMASQSSVTSSTSRTRRQLAPSHRFDTSAMKERCSIVMPSVLRTKRQKIAKKLHTQEFDQSSHFEMELDDLIKNYSPKMQKRYKMPARMEDRKWMLLKMQQAENKKKQRYAQIGKVVEESLLQRRRSRGADAEQPEVDQQQHDESTPADSFEKDDYTWLLEQDDETFEKEMQDRLQGISINANDMRRISKSAAALRREDREERERETEQLLKKLKQEQMAYYRRKGIDRVMGEVQQEDFGGTAEERAMEEDTEEALNDATDKSTAVADETGSSESRHYQRGDDLEPNIAADSFVNDLQRHRAALTSRPTNTTPSEAPKLDEPRVQIERRPAPRPSAGMASFVGLDDGVVMDEEEEEAAEEDVIEEVSGE